MKEINPLLAEKRQMLAEQAARREHDRPLSDHDSAEFGKALLERLDKGIRAPSPARISMTGPPPLANDHIPRSADPTPLGGCFADIAEDDK
jgi:hypothetical protein